MTIVHFKTEQFNKELLKKIFDQLEITFLDIREKRDINKTNLINIYVNYNITDAEKIKKALNIYFYQRDEYAIVCNNFETEKEESWTFLGKFNLKDFKGNTQMNETFEVSIMPEIADDILLKKILNDYGLTKVNINIVENEDDDVEYIISFDGKDYKRMYEAIYLYFFKIGSDGNGILKNSQNTTENWEFNTSKEFNFEFMDNKTEASKPIELKGLSLSASELAKEINNEIKDVEIDKATVEQEKLPEEWRAKFEPSVADLSALKKSIDDVSISLYEIFENETDDGETEFEIQFWEDEAKKMSIALELFFKRIGEDGFVYIYKTNGEIDEWKFN